MRPQRGPKPEVIVPWTGHTSPAADGGPTAHAAARRRRQRPGPRGSWPPGPRSACSRPSRLGLDLLAVAAHARRAAPARRRAPSRGPPARARGRPWRPARASAATSARASAAATSARTSAIASRVRRTCVGVGLAPPAASVAVALGDHLEDVGGRDGLGEAPRLQRAPAPGRARRGRRGRAGGRPRTPSRRRQLRLGRRPGAPCSSGEAPGERRRAARAAPRARRRAGPSARAAARAAPRGRGCGRCRPATSPVRTLSRPRVRSSRSRARSRRWSTSAFSSAGADQAAPAAASAVAGARRRPAARPRPRDAARAVGSTAWRCGYGLIGVHSFRISKCRWVGAAPGVAGVADARRPPARP